MGALRSAQYLLHLFALRKLVHQFIQISDLPYQIVVNFFNAMPADDTSDQFGIWVQSCPLQEGFERGILSDESADLLGIQTREPSDNLLQLTLAPPFLLYLLEIYRVDFGK